MLPQTIRSPPQVGDFTPLTDYLSQTPQSFVEGKPVLHLHLAGATASVPKSQKDPLPIFSNLRSESNNEPSDGPRQDDTLEQTVEVFVTSDKFTIFSNSSESGISIPYPSISIHAIKQVKSQGSEALVPAVWMQLEFADGGADDEDFDTIELTIIPSQTSASESASTTTLASQLYSAMSACSDLHPDPDDGEDDEDEEDNYDRIVFEGDADPEAVNGFTGVFRGAIDGGLPPPLPGSGGWITAENVNEYFDGEGNWIGPGAGGGLEEDDLGDGAGRTRGRDEVEQSEVNGHQDGDDADSKRVRTE